MGKKEDEIAAEIRGKLEAEAKKLCAGLTAAAADCEQELHRAWMDGLNDIQHDSAISVVEGALYKRLQQAKMKLDEAISYAGEFKIRRQNIEMTIMAFTGETRARLEGKPAVPARLRHRRPARLEG